MAKATTKPSDSPAAKSDKTDKPKKPQFDIAKALGADGTAVKLDENKRLTVAPSNWEAKFAPLGRQNFASKSVYLEWKLVEFDKQTDERAKRREEMVTAIKEAKEGVSPTKKKLKKLAKLQKQLAALQAEMEEQGVEI
jgi:hypothetical protein